MYDDVLYMKVALEEAKKSLKYDDVPIGAVIVKNNQIISKAHNLKEKKQIATNHAEVLAIEKACKKLKTWYLNECVLYVTVEPCLMCCGAIIQSRIKKVVYATKNEKFGYVESVNEIFQSKKNNHNVIIEKGPFEKESKELIVNFFKQKR